MRFSRSNYDKAHRCPGWSGGGWISAEQRRCPSGYITYGITRAEMEHIIDGHWWAKYPRAYHFGQCTMCDVVVWPLFTRWLDPTWLKWHFIDRPKLYR